MALAAELDKYFGAGTARRVLGNRAVANRTTQSGVNWDAIQAMAVQNATASDGRVVLVAPSGRTAAVDPSTVTFLQREGYQIATQDQLRANGYTPARAAVGTSGSSGGSTAPADDGDRPTPNQSAANIRNILTQNGLEELAGYVDRWVRQGLTWPEIEVQLRDPKTEPGQVFDRLVPEVRLRREKGLTPMSVAEIVQYRQNARQTMRAAGLPEGFYDSNEDFSNFIVNDVSLPELEERITRGVLRAMNAPPEVRQQLRDLYGVTEQGLAAYMLDPARALPVIQRQVAAAEIGGASVRTGFGQLSTSEAEDIASLGVSGSESEEGFNALASSQELFTPINQAEDTIGRGEQLSAAFRNNAAAQRRVQERAARRKAEFGGGGRLSTGREGIAGLSTAS